MELHGNLWKFMEIQGQGQGPGLAWPGLGKAWLGLAWARLWPGLVKALVRDPGGKLVWQSFGKEFWGRAGLGKALVRDPGGKLAWPRLW